MPLVPQLEAERRQSRVRLGRLREVRHDRQGTTLRRAEVIQSGAEGGVGPDTVVRADEIEGEVAALAERAAA